MGEFTLLVVGAILVFFGPIAGLYLGVHPIVLPVVGIACGLAGIVRSARPLPGPHGASSPGAEADALLLSSHRVDYSPKSGIGITDVGGAE